MFVADAPTTTTQRLKALATGGLPTFFDVSNSFTAGELGEDNLVDQLAGAGRRLVSCLLDWRCLMAAPRRVQRGLVPPACVPQRGPLPCHSPFAESPASVPCLLQLLHPSPAHPPTQAFLGDTTWQQLFPRQWAWSRPYPCFNVRDLHTVDDGVWEHLLPALRQPGAATWDGLLVAHYLGVDHCGHTHGTASEQMAAKLG